MKNQKLKAGTEITLFESLHHLSLKNRLKFASGWIVGLFAFSMMLLMSTGVIKTSSEVTTGILYSSPLAAKAAVTSPQKKRKNKYAPVDPGDLDDARTLKYIDRFSDVAVVEMNKFNIPASITLAQAIVESGSGTSTLAKKNNNHFGMKCFSKNCKKGHCSNHHDDNHKDFFRKFSTAWESFRFRSRKLSNSPERYKPLFELKPTDYKGWAIGLKACGWATDEKYSDKLISVIERFGLDKFDR